jgi:hypothetical protein
MRRLFFTLLLMATAMPSMAGTVPERASLYIPTLKSQISQAWPSVPIPASLAGQIEQETCPSLTHKKCWNPRTELKTDREHGFGLGQITITAKFNNFEEVKKIDAKLKSWKWEDRYNPAYQLRAVVLMDRVTFVKLSFAASDYERMAFMFSAYNGGLGGVMQDRRLALSKGADPNKWFGHVEVYSFKSKTKAQGYGQSFFEVNRGYVRNVLKVRMQKYQPFFN